MDSSKMIENVEISELIPIQNVGKVREKIAELNKRAAKLKLPPIQLSFGEKVSRRMKHYDLSIEITYIKCMIKGEYPRLPGYEFLAKLERVGERNVVYGSKDNFDESWVTKEAFCDHCKSKRARKETFLIKKEDTGEIKQIGSNCIDQFIGQNSLSAIAMRASLFKLFDDGDLFDFGVDDDMKLPRVVATEDFISCAIAATRIYGFVSKSAAEGQTNQFPTAVLAFNRIVPILPDGAVPEFNLVDADWEIAKQALENIDATIDQSNPSLASNIKTVVLNPDLHYDNIFLAAIFAKMALEKRGFDTVRKQEKPEVIAGEFLGKIGDKLQTKVTVEKKMNFESVYNNGGVNMIIMRDEAGNTLVTTTGGSFNPEIGSVVEIKGTIKAHKQYKEIKQTVLQRVSTTKCEAIEKLKNTIQNTKFRMSAKVKEEQGEYWKAEWTGDIRFDLDEQCKKHHIDGSCDIYIHLSKELIKNGGKGKFSLDLRSPSSHKETIFFDLKATPEGDETVIIAQMKN